MDLASRLFKGDRVIWIIFMFLCLISVTEVFSATSTIAYRNANYWMPIIRHTSFLLMGFAGVLILHNLPYKVFIGFGLFLPVAIFLLAITPFVGVEINGEPRWMEILGIRFQPSELAKLSAVCYMALVLSKRDKFTDAQMFKYILIGGGLACGFIFFNNGSTAVLLFTIMVMMMFIGQIHLKRIFKLVGFCVASLVLLLTLLFVTPDSVMEYMPDRFHTWKARIERFSSSGDRLDTKEGKVLTLDDEHYQEDHAKIAIVQGGLLGKKPGHGQQRDFLPQAYSDFIYAIIIEEMGLVGGFFVLFLYLALMIRVAMIARRCHTLFPKFLVLGCGLLIVTQALVNMAVAVGVFPVTGQPLPLISRGGTSTVISCVYIGIILSVSRFGANIGNEEDLMPAEEKTAGEETALPGVTQEEINQWVPEVDGGIAQPEAGKEEVKGPPFTANLD